MDEVTEFLEECECNRGDWALVSEPEFLDFQMFAFRDFVFLQNMFGKSGGEISRNK